MEKPDGNTPASTYKHGQFLKITSLGAHPVLEGVGAFEVVDETYKGMWISASNQLLLKTDNPTQPGHAREAHTHPGYRRPVRNLCFGPQAQPEPSLTEKCETFATQLGFNNFSMSLIQDRALSGHIEHVS